MLDNSKVNGILRSDISVEREERLSETAELPENGMHFIVETADFRSCLLCTPMSEETEMENLRLDVVFVNWQKKTGRFEIPLESGFNFCAVRYYIFANKKTCRTTKLVLLFDALFLVPARKLSKGINRETDPEHFLKLKSKRLLYLKLL